MNPPDQGLPGRSLPAATPAPAQPTDPVRPRVKPVDRSQLTWQMLDVERLIEAEHPARAIWELVGQLKLDGFYETIAAVPGQAGRTPWDPRLLISLWIYAYSRGISSAREISRRCRHEPAFQWLCGLGEINHHTLSDFRVAQAGRLENLFTQVLAALSAEGLITLERVMHDGTKIKALASKSSFCRQERLAEHWAAARQQVEALKDPAAEESPRQRAARARARRERQERLAEALHQCQELQQAKKPSQAESVRASASDPAARVMKQPDGGFAPAYNVQLSTDAAQKIIVAHAVSQSPNDYAELLPAMTRVEETFGQQPEQSVADGGFTCRRNILGMAARGIEFYGSLSEANPGEAGLARRGISPEFHPSAFQYDPPTNTYVCPQGKVLAYRRQKSRPEVVEHYYRAQRADCQACPFAGACCGSKGDPGRELVRLEERPEVKAFGQKMQTEEAKKIYRQRSEVAEFPNAWIKAKLGVRQFRLRGLSKVGLEVLWACLTYNVQQWIRLSWLPKLAARAA